MFQFKLLLERICSPQITVVIHGLKIEPTRQVIGRALIRDVHLKLVDK